MSTIIIATPFFPRFFEMHEALLKKLNYTNNRYKKPSDKIIVSQGTNNVHDMSKNGKNNPIKYKIWPDAVLNIMHIFSMHLAKFYI